jgi:hypothetical protein
MFIGHSLGGIIIKTALVIVRGYNAPSIFSLTKSIIFFGTPCLERELEVERCLTLERIFEAVGVKQDEALEPSRFIVNMMADASRQFHISVNMGMHENTRKRRELLVTSFYEREKYNGVLVSQYLI